MKPFSDLKLILKSALLSAVFTVLLLMLVNYFFNHSWNLFLGSSNMQPFTVQGTGSVTQKPDEAKISFTVTKTAPVLKDAQDQTNTQTNTIVSDLRKIGIAQKDIRTSNYSSYPIYNNSTIRMMPVRIPSYQTSRTITGYTVSENINVTLHNIIKANNVIDAITKDKAEKE